MSNLNLKEVKIAYGENLAVKDELVFNLDPLNMEDENSWGDAKLYGFNGVEKDENGNVISGFSGKDFNFDGVDDYIEIYSDSDFSQEGITIETYGVLNDESLIGNIYKGSVGEPVKNAFKYWCGNIACYATPDNVNFEVGGSFFQGVATGTAYQCQNARNDFHIPLNNNEIYEGEAYVTFSLKEDGSFYIFLNGKKVVEDRFNSDYVEGYKEYLKNKNYPIIVGKSSVGDHYFSYYKIKTYAIRLYNKVLSEEEAVDNYEKTVAYRELLENN